MNTENITADADLLVDGLLLDVKSTNRPEYFAQSTAHQLLGYLLLDTHDKHRIDSLGLYLTRTATLVRWPVEDYLDLLGTRRRELPALRAAFAELLAGCPADTVPTGRREDTAVRRLLDDLDITLVPGHCPVCAQPVPDPERRVYCSRRCGTRAPTLRDHGRLLSPPAFAAAPRPPTSEPSPIGTTPRPPSGRGRAAARRSIE